MARYTAQCPFCGRGIDFSENAIEYNCIFCGTRLLTAALAKERVEQETGGADKAEGAWEFGNESGRWRSRERDFSANAPELTDEETRCQLIRKAEFKKELRQVVKEIDDLRQKRPRYEAKKKLAKRFISCGLMLIAISALIVVVSFASADAAIEPSDAAKYGGDVYAFVFAAILLVSGNALIIIAECRKRSASKLEKRLESDISAKKQERDILIGRLNKIAYKLNAGAEAQGRAARDDGQ